MNDLWDKRKAKVKLKALSADLICGALLEQDIFAGVGKIKKNEILYQMQIHSESVVAKIPSAKVNRLNDETRLYSFQFLAWKRNYELKKHWRAHIKKIFFYRNLPFLKKHKGLKNRRSFICTKCQILYQ